MEPTRPQVPPEITVSSPRSSSFFDRVLRRTSSSGGPQSPPLESPKLIPSLHIPIIQTHDIRSRSPSRSRSRSRSAQRGAAILSGSQPTADLYHHHHHHHHSSTGSSTMMSSSSKNSTKMLLSVDSRVSRSRSHSRSRSSTRSPSPNFAMMNAQRVASINHVGRHTNDWLFSGFTRGRKRQ